MSTNYAFNSYWNPSWPCTIASAVGKKAKKKTGHPEKSGLIYPLDFSLQVDSGKPVVKNACWVPASGSTAWLPVVTPGDWPKTSNPPGFQAGDTVYFAFQMAGGNSPSSPSKLVSTSIAFMSSDTSLTNPIGITDTPGDATTVDLGGTEYGICTWTCQAADMVEVNQNKTTFAQCFNAGGSTTSGTSIPLFTFAKGNSAWSLSVQAVYQKTVGGSPETMRFIFDPEWKVGNG